MNNSEKPPLWLGIALILVGLFPIVMNAEPTTGTPQWVLIATCSIFISGGLIVLFPVTSYLMGPLIIIIFAGIATWIGFSPDATGCSSSMSLPFITRTKASSCSVFRIPAVILWGLSLWCIFYQIRSIFKKK